MHLSISTMKVILTGFGKFYNILENPSTYLVQTLRDDPHVTETRVIETAAVAVKQELAPLWDHARASGEPTLFFHLGVDDSAEEVHFEECAYNLADFCIPDEAGWEPQEEIIFEGEPDVIHTSLPVAKLVEEVGLGCTTSTDPGHYVCNYTYFHSLVHTKSHANQFVLFVHVPPFEVLPMEDQLVIIRKLLGLLVPRLRAETASP
ncbi:hypothetical protein ACHHYP_04975 [Achlya hypogyna]|uniref:Pyrrolidone-carboxylate peptidase n=1 Tax=Achlya hypogyna TaxID=1202772 RepID=A0A1V9YZ77_ACHHY|nr:hypothetical protein ACHHYP_04975 [Achlya hypogyna]